MEPAAPMSAAPASTLERESVELRARRLSAARRRATALLAGVTAVFVAVTVAGAHGTLLDYVQAGAEAAMVGGVADWFAVTALFRRPLGLPIPHTALIVERKDQFAATLGQFVQENFLNADVLTERIRSAGSVSRLAAWLADQANAARFAGQAADLVVTAAEALRDEDVQRVLTAEMTRAVDAVEVAPLAGRALRVIIAGGHHAELFNAIVSGADRYLGDHYAEIRQQFETESPRWMPDGVYRRLFDRLYTRLRHRLVAVAADPDDEARRQFEGWIAGLPDRLETSPELRERGEQLKRDVLGSAGLRDWSSSLWKKAKETLRTQAADPESELRRRLADVLAAAAAARVRPPAPGGLRAYGRIGSQGTCRSVSRRARWPCHRDHPAVGRGRDIEPAGAAPRARSAVHPDQRHGGGGGRGTGLARHHPGPGLIIRPAGFPLAAADGAARCLPQLSGSPRSSAAIWSSRC